jgi:hypothetical protein
MICVGGVQRLDDVERHRMNQRWEKGTIGSSDGMVFSVRYPTALWMPLPIYTLSTHPFEVAGLCGSTEECKTPRRSYPIHTSLTFFNHFATLYDRLKF